MSQLALLGGPRSKRKPFPEWPLYDDHERAALTQVLESRVWWRTPGTRTLRFEDNFARYHGARHGVAVSSGTAALEVAMAAVGIAPGDEVLVPDFTFFATASAVLCAGAIPVMVDIRPDTFCIDPDLAEAAITPRTRAIIAVHTGGHPADLDRLVEIAGSRGLALVEDCSQAHASQWNGRCVGTFGIAGAFSFQAGKLMTAGEGGILLTQDDQVERLARSVHDCGRMPGQGCYDHFIYGSNYRLTEWQGAVLEVQLTRLNEQTARRHKNARLLDHLLREIEGITPQKHDMRCNRNSQYAYIFHYNRKAFAGASTARFIEALNAEGIPCETSYPPLHTLQVFTSGEYRKRLSGQQAAAEHPFLRRGFPQTHRAAFETVWIPHPVLLGDAKDMHEIAAAVKKVQRYARELAAVPSAAVS